MNISREKGVVTGKSLSNPALDHPVCHLEAFAISYSGMGCELLRRDAGSGKEMGKCMMVLTQF